MYRIRFTFMFVVMCSLFFGCAIKQEKKTERYLFPIGSPNPKIEHLYFYSLDVDIRRGRLLWQEEYLLGRKKGVPLFVSPYDVSSTSGKVYVTDPGKRTVILVDFEAEKVNGLLQGKSERYPFVLPMGIVARGNTVYVTDIKAQKIIMFENGVYSREFGEGIVDSPLGIDIDESTGNVFVVDARKHRVVVFTEDGEFLYTFGKQGVSGKDFNYPVDVACDDKGNVFVLDTLNARVKKLTVEGELLLAFGERGTESGSFQLPKGIAVSTEGHVYVSESRSHKIVIFSSDGDYLFTLGARAPVDNKNIPGGFNTPKGIDVSPDNNIWIIDSYGRKLHQYFYLSEQYLIDNPIDPSDIFTP